MPPDSEIKRWTLVGEGLVVLNAELRMYSKSVINSYCNLIKGDIKANGYKDPSGHFHKWTKPRPWSRLLTADPSHTWPPTSADDFARTFLQSFYIEDPDFSIDTTDISATLNLLKQVPDCFPNAVQAKADHLRQNVRNKWGHVADMALWTDANFQGAIDTLADLAQEALGPQHTVNKTINDLKSFDKFIGGYAVDMFMRAEQTWSECLKRITKEKLEDKLDEIHKLFKGQIAITKAAVDTGDEDK